MVVAARRGRSEDEGFPKSPEPAAVEWPKRELRFAGGGVFPKSPAAASGTVGVLKVKEGRLGGDVFFKSPEPAPVERSKRELRLTGERVFPKSPESATATVKEPKRERMGD